MQYFYALLKLPFSGIYMKIFYFFDISLIISRIDLKQTETNVLKPMHSFPFIFFYILAIFLFFLFFCTIDHTFDKICRYFSKHM